MKNPFPGMDPWMETQWGDAHHRLIVYASDRLRAVLPGDLKPRVQERVYVETPAGTSREFYPDVRVVEHAAVYRPSGGTATTNVADVAAAQPLLVDVQDEPLTEGFIEVIDRAGNGRVITVIEVLSPSNKLGGEGRRQYRQKLKECKAGETNFVEIDFLRGGRRGALIADWRLPISHRTPYRVNVWRAARPHATAVYRIPLRERLPAISIPLRPTDSDVTLDLQPLIDAAYVNGTYEDTDYSVPPIPPLDPDDAAWAFALLRERKLR